MEKPCNTIKCPKYEEMKLNKDSKTDSDGMEWYCASCGVYKKYCEYLEETGSDATS